MTGIKMSALVSLIGFGLVSAGCSSSSGGRSGTGGMTGTGGSTSSSGGNSATGGAAGGGEVVDAAVLGCPASDPPPSETIADFVADAGLAIMGGYYRYGNATPQPIYNTAPGQGTVEVTDTVQVSATANYYQGFGIFFNGDSTGANCIDASQYTGVQFDLSGSLTGPLCTMQFTINDSEHSDSSVPKDKDHPDAGMNDPKASGPMGSYGPQLEISAAQLTSTPVTIKVPFMGTGAPTGGSPATPLDVKKIEGIGWQMTTPLAGDGAATECDWDITISNVKFY